MPLEFQSLYMVHDPVVQISDSQNRATSVKCNNNDLGYF